MKAIPTDLSSPYALLDFLSYEGDYEGETKEDYEFRKITYTQFMNDMKEAGMSEDHLQGVLNPLIYIAPPAPKIITDTSLLGNLIRRL